MKEYPIHNGIEQKYKMSLYVYPVARCGVDLQKGKPLEVSVEGSDLFELKLKTEELVLSLMSSKNYEGECFVELRTEKNGEYHDSDEWWAVVDLVAKKVRNEGRYVQH